MEIKKSDPIYIERVRKLNRKWRRKSEARPEYRERKKLYMVEWAKKNKDKIKANHKKWFLKHRARQALKYAIETGKIKKMPCIKCKNPVAQGHHEDYSKPLDVIWLCQKHHSHKHHSHKRRSS